MRTLVRITIRMTHTEKLLSLMDRYCEATKRSQARVSTIVLGSGHRIGSIRNGAGFTFRIYDRAVAWFSDNWPENAVWPDGVERPTPQNEAA